MRNIIFFLVTTFTISVLKAQNNIEISTDNLKSTISYLASDSLKGRKPGTPGDSLSAFFIRSKFKEYGTIPIYDQGFQRFYVVTEVLPGKRNSLKINDVAAKINEDFIPASFSSDDSLESVAVFAGYGFNIHQDSLKWNDYDSIDVKNKWVLILQGKPEGIENITIAKFSKDRTKVLTAKDKGAKGILIVHEKNGQNKLSAGIFDKTVSDAGVPVFIISRETAEKILKENNLNLDTLKIKLTKEQKPVSKNLKTKITGIADVIQVKVPTTNVVSILEGTDSILKNEYIVIGAHYDHLGMGGQESGSRMPDTTAVHNGADDNASGVAGILELARVFAASPAKPKRTLIFVSFSGEEMGLLGSKQFVKEPPFPLKSIKAMFNFDMIGRIKNEDPTLSVGGTGTSAETDSLIKLFDKDLPFTVTKSPEGYGPSDHASFYKNDIPVFFFFSGMHDDYHTPLDDVEKINFPQETNILKFSYQLINSVANLDKSLTFKEAGSKEENRSPGYKVTLGIIPDVVGSGNKGLSVDGVKKGGPAETGGIKKGDIITAINGLPVTNIYDYMTRLNTLNKGQIVEVEVLREGEKKIFKVKL
ncbi:MAG: hypothetical protein COX07_04335 [Bacteroidetes bacterium CG23_combo_of_CG06-09_8_20_14_all_32_9]|nr:MAG: hypothetical protein COX07_04335 [Bacteroidetes bacterium CG23_combo_of_CG06-09_8_20_14_all_32_9]